jgi:glyceraldehyde 3-phosphate dehydrogenase
LFKEQDPISNKWSDAGAEYAIESSGIFITMEKTRDYWKGKSKIAIFFAPSTDSPTNSPMFVMGVNHDRSMKIYSRLSAMLPEASRGYKLMMLMTALALFTNS